MSTRAETENAIYTRRRLSQRADPAGQSGSRSLRALSGGVEDPEAIGSRRISIYDLDWRPSPLPNADAWRAGELDLPAGAFEADARPGFGDACPAGAVKSQQLGEDDDRVVTLEGDEGW